jgi:DNA-binding GntR family transcriptional regulator
LETQWSQRLGIGQPTLREALRDLEHQGLLTKTPKRGTYVAQLEADDYQRILEVRIPLEAIAVGRAAARLDPQSERELSGLVVRMAGVGGNFDVRDFHECDVSFHRRIWQLADNNYLSEMLEKITFRLFVFSVAGRWPHRPKADRERTAAVHQHRGIMDGIRTRDARKARHQFVRHTVKYWNDQYHLKLKVDELEV